MCEASMETLAEYINKQDLLISITHCAAYYPVDVTTYAYSM